jgi:nucleoside-diphosphate-sugar epimerase
MQRVVVTGAAGYVGSVLCAGLLARGYEVVGIDKLLHGGRSLLGLMQHRGFRFVRADIADLDTYGDLIDSDTMVAHLAAIVGEPASDKMPEETQKTNVLSTRRLIELVVGKHARKLVFVSTCSNYGKVQDGRMATEDDHLNPLSLYARTKVDVERYLTDEIAESVDWTILRFATVYGLSLRPRFDLTVNDFTLHAITDKKLVIYLPYSRRPYVHVLDAAGALQLVLEKQNGTRWQIFNVGANDANYRKVEIVE